MSVDFSGLNSFRRKVASLSKINKIEDKLVDFGVNYAKKQYEGKDFDVFRDGNSVVATGKGIAFEEFGTGRVGEAGGYPKDKLPKKPIIFESKHKTIITNGWVYYYPNKRTKRTVLGVEGWYVSGKKFNDGRSRFVTGDKPQAEMWKTSIAIRKNANKIMKGVLKFNNGK